MLHLRKHATASSAVLPLWIAALVISGTEAGAVEPKFHPDLHITKMTGSIRIDGELDDPGWQNATAADGFVETDPGDQIEPPVQSRVWITYDDANLYVALIAEDDPSTIRVSLRERDDIWSDDYFGILLDTYGTLQWGYEIFVNPLGIQGDLRVNSDGSEDMGFDLIWDSKGKVTETGYQVELAIPFSSLRFENRPEQRWRVNFWRDHQRDVRRRYTWAAQDRDDPCWMCQWGYLSGIREIQPSADIELIASALGYQSGALLSHDPTAPFENDRLDGAASLSARYGITSSISAEATINPDFSQIESDAAQIDVNDTFALFYPERRPFFQEGSDLYATWIDAIYPRSINNPSVAAKLTGQVGRTALLYLVGRDDDSPLVIPLSERSVLVPLGASVSNLARVRHSFHRDSWIGGLVTDRRVNASGSGTVLSADANVRFLRNYNLELQYAASHTEEPDAPELIPSYQTDLDGDGAPDRFDGKHTVALDGESFWGDAFYGSIERGGRNWNSDFDYWSYSPTFRTDNGFTTQNDYRQLVWWNGFSFQPNKRALLKWEPSLSIGRIFDHDNHFEDEWIRPNLWLQFPYQTSLFTEYLISAERFGVDREVIHGIRIFSTGVETRVGETLSAGFDLRMGKGIYRDPNAPELADQASLSARCTFKPTQRLRIEPRWDYSRMKSRFDDRTLFEGYIVRTRSIYNFTREWSCRLVLQYNQFSDRFDVEPLVTYRVNPFTVFFLGATSQYQYFSADPAQSVPESDWRQSQRQVFAKVQYLFRI